MKEFIIESKSLPKFSELKVGDMVRVKSLKEVMATLDGSKCSRIGTLFAKEMEKYCGKEIVVENFVSSNRISARNWDFVSEWLEVED